MTQEIVKEFVAYQDPESAEHSAFARSRKVIAGPMIVPEGEVENPPLSGMYEGTGSTIAPIHAATGTELVLLKNKAYRLISSVPVYFRQSAETDVAVIGDIYLPANTPIVISTKEFSFLPNIAVSAAGIIQAVEVK